MNRKLLEEYNHNGSVIQLWARDVASRKEYEMIIDGVFIMASYNHLSSELLIRHAMHKLPAGNNLRILIGGLGMGFTVKEACSYQQIVRIDVVEIEPVVGEWNRKYLSEYNGDCLKDERVQIIIDDFYDYVLNTGNCYDIISMDIDNGPMMLVKAGNERVYEARFFIRIKEIMPPTGVFVIWSCDYDRQLQEHLQQVFASCQVEEVVEEYQHLKIPYYLYFASNSFTDT